ncbi:hypothetical protein F2Q69_00049685 [Brassica cretica]|uniref:AP2/ERF domain-containing protein n=2 Tax=Brassica TaxID=3705 RepID=A0A8S9PQB3_BRACR|nr:hypothetical protein F2Q69_00049685 [Brassica cretica]
MEKRTRRVKFTEHCTVKPVPAKPSNGSPRVVRIAFTDPFATVSSSDEENDKVCPTPRVKRYVEEIRFGETKPSSSKPARKARCKPERGGGERKADVSDPRKYRGVRQRRWGSFAAEIRDSSTRIRIWSGTFATAEESSRDSTQRSQRSDEFSDSSSFAGGNAAGYRYENGYRMRFGEPEPLFSDVCSSNQCQKRKQSIERSWRRNRSIWRRR